MAKGNSIFQMVIILKVFSKKESLKDLEPINGRMALLIKENLKMAYVRVKVR